MQAPQISPTQPIDKTMLNWLLTLEGRTPAPLQQNFGCVFKGAKAKLHIIENWKFYQSGSFSVMLDQDWVKIMTSVLETVATAR